MRGNTAVAARTAILGTVLTVFAIPEIALAISADRPGWNALEVLADEAGRTPAAQTSAAVAAALFAGAIGLTDGDTLTVLALLVTGALAAGAATAVAAAFQSCAIRIADWFALVVVAEIIVVTLTAGAAATVRAALFTGAVRLAILALPEFFLAGVVDGAEEAVQIEVQAALPEDALGQCEKLILCFGSSLVETIEETLSPGNLYTIEGALEKFTAGFA